VGGDASGSPGLPKLCNPGSANDGVNGCFGVTKADGTVLGASPDDGVGASRSALVGATLFMPDPLQTHDAKRSATAWAIPCDLWWFKATTRDSP
jgi:hypothetical protein